MIPLASPCCVTYHQQAYNSVLCYSIFLFVIILKSQKKSYLKITTSDLLMHDISIKLEVRTSQPGLDLSKRTPSQSLKCRAMKHFELEHSHRKFIITLPFDLSGPTIDISRTIMVRVKLHQTPMSVVGPGAINVTLHPVVDVCSGRTCSARVPDRSAERQSGPRPADRRRSSGHARNARGGATAAGDPHRQPATGYRSCRQRHCRRAERAALCREEARSSR